MKLFENSNKKRLTESAFATNVAKKLIAKRGSSVGKVIIGLNPDGNRRFKEEFQGMSLITVWIPKGDNYVIFEFFKEVFAKDSQLVGRAGYGTADTTGYMAVTDETVEKLEKVLKAQGFNSANGEMEKRIGGLEANDLIMEIAKVL